VTPEDIVRYRDGAGRCRWMLALTALSDAAVAAGLNPWERPFRFCDRRWFVWRAGRYVPQSREVVEALVRRSLDRHYRVAERRGQTSLEHIGVNNRLVKAVVAAMARLTGVAAASRNLARTGAATALEAEAGHASRPVQRRAQRAVSAARASW